MFELDRAKSGVPGIDELTEGGFPRGSMILVAGGTGTGKTILASQFIHNGAAEYGEKGVYATLEEDIPTFKRNMLRFGFDFARLEKEGQAALIDPQTLRSGGLDINLRQIIDKMEEVKATRLVVDSLTALLAACEEKLSYRSAIYLIYEQLKAKQYTTLMTLSVPLGSLGLGMGIEEFLTDGLFQLENVIDGYEMKTRLMIRKLRGTDHSRKVHRVMFLPTGLEIVPFTTT